MFDCSLTYHFHTNIPLEVTFDLTQQVTLNIDAVIGGILGNCNGNAGTIKTNCFNVTLKSSKLYLKASINYLLKPSQSQQQTYCHISIQFLAHLNSLHHKIQ